MSGCKRLQSLRVSRPRWDFVFCIWVGVVLIDQISSQSHHTNSVLPLSGWMWNAKKEQPWIYKCLVRYHRKVGSTTVHHGDCFGLCNFSLFLICSARILLFKDQRIDFVINFSKALFRHLLLDDWKAKIFPIIYSYELKFSSCFYSNSNGRSNWYKQSIYNQILSPSSLSD